MMQFKALANAQKQNVKNNIVFVIRGEFHVTSYVYAYLVKIQQKKKLNLESEGVKDVTV